jgi:hypothetical protein
MVIFRPRLRNEHALHPGSELKIELGCFKYLFIRPESNLGSGLNGLAYLLSGVTEIAPLKSLGINPVVTLDLHLQTPGQSIDHLIRQLNATRPKPCSFFIEFSPGLKNSQTISEAGLFSLGCISTGMPRAIVNDCN